MISLPIGIIFLSKNREALNDINNVLGDYNPNKEFDSYLFKKLVDEITINDRNRLTFKFKIGYYCKYQVNIYYKNINKVT